MTDSKKKALKIVLVIAALFLVFYGLKAAGFHVQGLSVVKGGVIELTHIDEDVDIFLDNSKTDIDADRALIQNVSPDAHSIIVSKQGFWPWVKENVAVQSGQTTTLTPFLVSKNVTGEIITQNDPEYRSIRSSIERNDLPTRFNPIESDDESVIAFVENGLLIAVDSEKEITVLPTDVGIRNIAFYKDRSDVLLMSSQDGVFAIETDLRFEPQNFQPIYKGTAFPQFIKEDNQTVYVLDGELLFLVSL